MTRDEYLAFRRPYEPDSKTLVIIAESPPASGKYFYNPAGARTEPLFSALMKQLSFMPAAKEDGLQEFRRRGWMLVDATYHPVDGLDGPERDRVIERDYPLLRKDLAALLPDRGVPIVVIKANVCAIVAPRLTADGFRVLNEGRSIYFPSHGRQQNFHDQFGATLRSAGLQGGLAANESVGAQNTD